MSRQTSRTLAAASRGDDARAARRPGSRRSPPRSRAPAPDRRRAGDRAGPAARPSPPGRRAGRSAASGGRSAPARLARQPHVAEEGRSVEPLVGPGQGSGQGRRVERLARLLAAVQAGGQGAQIALGAGPSCRAPPAASGRCRSRGRSGSRLSRPRPGFRRAHRLAAWTIAWPGKVYAASGPIAWSARPGAGGPGSRAAASRVKSTAISQACWVAPRKSPVMPPARR